MQQPPFFKQQNMYDYIYTGDFAGVQLIFTFRHPDTVSWFSGWLSSSVSDLQEELIVSIPVSDCDCWMKDYGLGDDGNTEFGMSVYRASDVLLPYRRCVFHGAAMLWRDRAWLFTAEGGTGKSTQLKHWMDLYPEEVQIINGDKPVLKLEEDGTVTVHPSPWKGKEEWGEDSLSAPLGGVITLKQGKTNVIERLQPIHCAARLLSLFFSAFETEDAIRSLCRFEEAILKTVPIWGLTNLGDPDSARMTHETLLEWDRKKQK